MGGGGADKEEAEREDTSLLSLSFKQFSRLCRRCL